MTSGPHSPRRWVGARLVVGSLRAVAAVMLACGSGRPSEPATGGAVPSPAVAAVARADGGGASDAPAAPPAPAPSGETAVVAALAAAIGRDDGRALADVVDPDFGLTLYATQGVGSGHVVLDAIAVGETTAPSRRPRRAPPGAPVAWPRSGWGGVAAAIEAGLDRVAIEPPDPSSPSFGFCRGQYGLPGDGAPRGAYLLRDRDDRDLHMLDTPDRAPRVPPLTGLTIFGNARIQVALRPTVVGWRVVHVVIDDRCRGAPDP
ncbi:MAG: hypothetical protein IPH80_02840 [Myxococcales bacterium]|nr:hypothetical protein [Myxococcales bacterium]MBP6844713.1 hypothetical protein [Kofleriaceae bacterium]